MGAKPAKPAKPAEPIACPGCPECEYCEVFDDCETFWNNEFITQAGASGDAQQNEWRYDYKKALEFVQAECKHKTGKDTVANLPFCNMENDDDCTETRTLGGEEVQLTSIPHEADCVSALCTQGGSTQFVKWFDPVKFEASKCTGGSIRELVVAIQDANAAKALSESNAEMSEEYLNTARKTFYDHWSAAWDTDKVEAQDTVLDDNATCLIPLQSTTCAIKNDNATTTLSGIDKADCDNQGGVWDTVENTDTQIESNLARCNAEETRLQPIRKEEVIRTRRLLALYAMHKDIGGVTWTGSEVTGQQGYPDLVIDKCGKYSEWGACDRSTGQHTRTFTKHDPSAEQHASVPPRSGCARKHSLTKTCNVDCEGAYETVSGQACDKQTGQRLTERFVVTQRAWHGGQACSPDKYEDCKVDCEVDWGVWGDCDKQDGEKTQSYQVRVQPKNGGDACPPPRTRTCVVDCEGHWLNWTACDCGSTTRTRTYSVTVQSKNGGEVCPEEQSESCASILAPREDLGSDRVVGSDYTFSGNTTIRGWGYRGCQNTTRSGRTCAKWKDHTDARGRKYFDLSIKPAKMEIANVWRSSDHNYCRNVRHRNHDRGGAYRDTIWCWVEDTEGSEYEAELCDPLSYD